MIDFKKLTVPHPADAETDVATDEDIEFGSYEEAPKEQWPVIDGGTYYARPVAWDVVDKAEYKQRAQLAELQKKKRDATLDDIDDKQWQITFAISRGENEGFELKYKFNRTDNWHEKTTAAITVAALADMDKYNAGALRARYGSVKGLIAAAPECVIDVALVQSEHDNMWRNYVNAVKPIPKKIADKIMSRQQAQQPQQPAQRPQGAARPQYDDGLGYDEVDPF